MSNTIDQKVVEMRFDNKQFESNVKTSMSTLDKLKQSLKMDGVSKGLNDVNTASKNCNLSGLSNAADTVRAKFSALQVMAITALANITNSAVNAGKKIVSALTIDPITSGFQEYETQINAIQTILANTSTKGTTLDQVNDALDELNTYADKTIYNFTEMTRNIGTFTAAGIDLDTSVAAIKGIANLAAVSGSTSQQASTAMYQLSQALSSGTVKLMDWNSVTNAGMGGQVFQDALKDTARVHGIAIDDMIEAEGSFRNSLQNGWLTSGILTETLSKFTGDLNEEQLKTMGYTDEQIKSIIKMGNTANDAATKVKTFTQLFDTLKEAAQSGWTQSWEIIVGDFEEAKALLTEMSDTFGALIGKSADARNELLQGWKDLDGRAKLIEALRNAFEGIVSIITPVKEAFREIFPPATSEQLVAITEGLVNITKSLKLSDKTSENLKRTFKGLFAILDIVKQLFSALFIVIKPLFSGLDELGDGVLGVTASWGDWLVNLSNSIRESGVFVKAIQGIVDVIKKVVSAIREFLSVIGEKIVFPAFQVLSDILDKIKKKLEKYGGVTEIFKKAIQGIIDVVKKVVSAIKSFFTIIGEHIIFPGFEALHSILEKLHSGMSKVGDAAGNMKSVFVLAIEAMGKALTSCKLVQFLQGLWKLITTVAKAIISVLGKAVGGLADKLANADFEGIFDTINSLLTGGVLIGIIKFFETMTKSMSGFKSIVDGIAGILDGVRGCFEAYQTKIKADALLKIAIAIAILTASIFVLSTIDEEKLNSSLGAIALMFAELLGALAVFNKISGGAKKSRGAIGAMLAISLSVLILASALKKLADLDEEQLSTGLLGVAALTAIIVAAAKVMGTGGKTVVKGAVQMIVFALAIKVLASACKDLSQLSWTELAKGLVGVGVLMTEIVLFLKTAKFDRKSLTTAIGILILAAAIKVLASACKTFSQMSWEQIAKGLVGVGALLLELVGFTKLMGNPKKMITTGIALIAIATAMKILASACGDFGKMSWEAIAKGLVGIGALLLEVAAFAKLTGNSKKLISTSIALVIIGSAMKIFASAVTDLAQLSWEGLAKGMIGMAGALAIVVVAMKLMPKNLIGTGIGLIAVSTALLIISAAMVKMGSMSWEQVAKGLVTLAGSMLILAVGLNVMKGTLSGSAALLVAALALAVLAPALSLLGAMSWKSIAKGLLTIAGVFAILGVAGLVLSPLVPVILALSGAFALIGVGVLAVGVGLLAAGAGLSALAIGFTALATAGAAGATAVVAALTVIIVGVADLIPVVLAKIGEGIIELCKVLTDGAPAIGEAVKAIILMLVDVLNECVPPIVNCVLNILTTTLVKIAEYTPIIVQAVFDILIACLQGIADNISMVVQTAIDIVLNFLDGIAQKIPDVIQAGFDLLLSFINGLTDAINKNTPLLVEAMTNLVLALIDAAICVLTGGIDLFKKIGEKIMNSGLVQGIKDKVSTLVSTVSDFIKEAKDAITDKIHEWVDIGKNIINGLIEGIKNVGKDIGDAVSGFVNDAVNGVKNFLGIHSPSRVFAEIGRYCDEGMVEGLNQYSYKVADATENVGDTALNTMNNTMSKLADAVEQDIESEPTIKPVMDLSGIQNGTNQLYKMMNSVDGYSVSGSIGIAEKTASSISNKSSNNQDSINNSMIDGLNKAIKDLVANPSKTFENHFTITGNNPQEIAEEVSKIIQKQVERRDASWA